MSLLAKHHSPEVKYPVSSKHLCVEHNYILDRKETQEAQMLHFVSKKSRTSPEIIFDYLHSLFTANHDVCSTYTISISLFRIPTGHISKD